MTVLGPQHHVAGHQIGPFRIRHDHLDPRVPGLNIGHVPPDLVLNSRTRLRTAQLGHHHRVTTHPYVSVHVTELHIAKLHGPNTSQNSREIAERPRTLPGCSRDPRA
jgi:hypothetical protein